MSELFEIARGIEVTATEPYLRATGWELLQRGDFANRWRLRQDQTVRNVAVPRSDVLEPLDQARLLTSVLDILREVEQRPLHLIARDLSEAASDLLEFRLVADELVDGSMPLKAAPELTSGAFEAVQSAARAEVRRRAHYAQGNLPTEVRSLVDRAVFAGTDTGSVILRVKAPAVEEPDQTTIEGLGVDRSFERRAVQRLLHGVRAAKAAAHRDAVGLPDALERDVDDGLSANLCDALLKLSGAKNGLDARIVVRVRWALTRPTDEASTSIDLDYGEVAQMERISGILKEIDPVPNAAVVGPVVQLKREPGEASGTILMRAEVDGRLRTVRAELTDPDLEVAFDALRGGTEIEVVGTLERAGTIREIGEIQAVSPLQSAER